MLFVASADEMYGPITMLWCDNHLVKHIPWSAFKMVESDWLRAVDVTHSKSFYFHFATQFNKEHQDSNCNQQTFSSEKELTLWCALLALKELQTVWETKHDNPKYVPYKNTLTDSLEKIGKYYSCLHEKPSTVLALGNSWESILSHYWCNLGSSSPIL